MTTKTWLISTFALVAALPLTGCGSRLQTERDELWAQNGELQSEIERLRALLDRKDAEIADLQMRLASQPVVPTTPIPQANDPFAGLGDGITSSSDGNVVTVRIPGDVLFDSGKIALKGGVKKSLNEIAKIIKKEYPGQTIRIEGYTDTDPIKKSGWDDNLELSLQRAAAVLRYLDKQGIKGEQMYAAGFGQYRPLSSKAESRRVEIQVLLNE